jgi:RNA polymerase sigma factor (TIGR02999 family)
MSDLSQLLYQAQQGDPGAANDVFALVYEELKRMASAQLARERLGQSLHSTALVHELYLRMLGADRPMAFENRRHFFAAASEAMRRILVDGARRRNAHRRGGDLHRREFIPDAIHHPREMDPAELLAVHELLEEFAGDHPRQAEVVKLKYYLGCSFEEIGEVLGHSADTIQDDWQFARAWLKRVWARSQRERG